MSDVYLMLAAVTETKRVAKAKQAIYYKHIHLISLTAARANRSSIKFQDSLDLCFSIRLQLNGIKS